MGIEQAYADVGRPPGQARKSLRDSRTLASKSFSKSTETIATLPGGWDLAHAIRLGIKPFAGLGANSEALSGSQVDSPCSCRAIFESAPVAMLQSQKNREINLFFG